MSYALLYVCIATSGCSSGPVLLDEIHGLGGQDVLLLVCQDEHDSEECPNGAHHHVTTDVPGTLVVPQLLKSLEVVEQVGPFRVVVVDLVHASMDSVNRSVKVGGLILLKWQPQFTSSRWFMLL